MESRTVSLLLLFVLIGIHWPVVAESVDPAVPESACPSHPAVLSADADPDARKPAASHAPCFLPPTFDDSAQLTPLLLSVPRAPQPVRATDGRFHLVYELKMLNFGSFPAVRPTPPTPPPATLEVTEVALFSDAQLTPFLVLSGEALASRMQLVRLGISPPTVNFQPGQSGILFLDATFPSRQAVPKRILHRVTVKAVAGTGGQPNVDETFLELPVNPAPVVVIGPFLRGGPWANFNGCCDFATPHRRIGRAVNGREFWPERFAIDVLKAVVVGDQLKVFRGDGSQVEDWFSTGEDILAVADGVVTRVVTTEPDNPIGTSPFPPVVSTGGGNEVLVHLGDGLFTMYGHLLPGTVSVAVGDRVRRGDVLGKLGNTGQSSAPHLHFQVMDDNSIAASQGLPWVFESFVLVGTFDEEEDGAITGIIPVNSVRRGELPLQQTLIRFP